MRLTGSYASHAEACEAGDYDSPFGLFANPDKIQAPVRPVDDEVSLVEPNERLTVEEACLRFGDLMVDLSALEVFGVCDPEVQRDGPIVVVWKVGVEFHVAQLGGGPRERYIFTNARKPGSYLPAACAFLVKSAA